MSTSIQVSYAHNMVGTITRPLVDASKARRTFVIASEIW